MVRIRINPPINPKFINTADDWNGKKCIMSVVGTRNSKSNDAPILWSFPNKRNPTPVTKQEIAEIKRTIANPSGIPLFSIELRTKLNLNIFEGIATAKVVAIHNLPKKSKEFLLVDSFIDKGVLVTN